MNDEPTYQFIDTNVLVYAHDQSAGQKHDRAKALIERLWESKEGCLSIQVLQEFYVTATRKVTRPIASGQALEIIDSLGLWRIHSPTVEDIHEAIAIQERYQISFWDAMIICSAERLGCKMLWSEDLNAGQLYRNILVSNPLITEG